MCTPTRLSESSRAASRGSQNSFAVRAPRSSAWRVGPVSTTISQSPRLSRQAASAIVVHCRSGVIRRVPQVRARRQQHAPARLREYGTARDPIIRRPRTKSSVFGGEKLLIEIGGIQVMPTGRGSIPGSHASVRQGPKAL
jgi:hypothetical protein